MNYTKADKLVQVYNDIDFATKISHATLSEIMENTEDDRTQYILLGIIEQLERIKQSVTLFDEIMKSEVLADE